MKWVIAIPCVGAGNSAICLLLRQWLTLSLAPTARQPRRQRRSNRLLREGQGELFAPSRIELPNCEHQAHPQHGNVECEDQPGDTECFLKQLLMEPSHRSIQKVGPA